MALGLNEGESDNVDINQDDLINSPETTESQVNKPAIRQVRLILDHSAFVRGIGNVKRWFNDEYVKANATRSNEVIHLSIFIPSYTLHEFEFVKRGTSISATNAREAIRFIDNYFENEDNEDRKNSVIEYDLSLESSTDTIPSWNSCLRYKTHSPKVKEFPNYKTKFDSNLIGQSGASGERRSSKGGNDENDFDINFTETFDSSLSFKERSNSVSSENSNDLPDSNQYAEMPARLKYLIRTCIYKRFLEKHESHNDTQEWKLVTEDSIAKIWAKSFGIDCVNVNEAELLIFKSYDVNSFRIYNPHNNFSVEEEFDPSSNILQNTIDTTLYSYTTVHEDAPNNKNSRGRSHNNRGNRRGKKGRQSAIPTTLAVQSARQTPDGSFIKREKFQAINYAPRGSGDLWEP
ncbi:uncharacterized protein SPAPADRAFT_66253 [Spathaspora passalidarum NRRL Y-27907]|uniref:Nonsense-mediated decay protein 4 n=1 Tax=Spathaspora passalidarum (strain NRRL Y-27907 / 11-Y1) TaxID=619300 RepID=G3ALM8_SPAPN|nr:uncharacterized protein SPAPADRAFT_66253 [Spathaspora passalidarum NRRL Y-27907]EGW33271.1 hypothetical protein SPAPADRAFT_66253 [Spathaspora passalidarum NRRL Y-27907]